MKLSQYFNGDEGKFQLWKIQFFSNARLQKLSAVIESSLNIKFLNVEIRTHLMYKRRGEEFVKNGTHDKILQRIIHQN